VGPFSYNQTDRVFFQSLGKKNEKLFFVTRNRGDTMGVSGYGIFFRLWAVRACSAQWRSLTMPWATPSTAGAMKIKRGVVYSPTIHHGYLLEENRHPGHRQPWLLPPPMVRPRPFCLMARVDRAMGKKPAKP
jgi:hypothetical protein